MKIISFISVILISIYAQSEIIQIVPSPVPSAHGMYVKNQNEVWLADTFKKRDKVSQFYDLLGNPISRLPTGSGISGISKHPLKDVMSFCDTMKSEIIWLNPAGETVMKFSIANPWNARWNSSGTLQYVVTYSGSVFELSSIGNAKEIVRGLDAPFDIAPIGENSFWVSEQGEKGSGQVCKYKKMGNDYQKVICNHGVQLENPEGLWPLADEGVISVDAQAGTLVRIYPDGSTKILEKDLGIPILVQLLDDKNWAIFSNQTSKGPAIVFGKSDDL